MAELAQESGERVPYPVGLYPQGPQNEDSSKGKKKEKMNSTGIQ